MLENNDRMHVDGYESTVGVEYFSVINYRDNYDGGARFAVDNFNCANLG